MKHFFIAILLFFSLTSWAEEQPVVSHSGLQADIGYDQNKESNLLPNVHSGAMLGLRYFSSRQSAHISQWEAGLQVGALKTEYEPTISSTSIRLWGKYASLFLVYTNGPLSVLAGPGSELNYNMSMYPNWDESHLYMANFLGVGAHLLAKYIFRSGKWISLKVEVPILSAISRSLPNKMYKIDNVTPGGIISDMHSRIKVVSFSKNFLVDSTVEYRFNPTKKYIPALCYTLRYNQLNDKIGYPFQQVQHLTGIKFYLR
ncbi:MAG TPA: hypothetical protein PKH79_01765 [Prolixibacteraceae bacterium]|nr:hypothetical protein [Prolixibacteraceae bacterium]